MRLDQCEYQSYLCAARLRRRFKCDVSVGGCSSVGRVTAVITFINRSRNVKRYRHRSRSLSSSRQHSRCRCPRGFYRREASKKFYNDDDVTRHRSLLFNSPGLPSLVFACPSTCHLTYNALRKFSELRRNLSIRFHEHANSDCYYIIFL